MERIIPNTVYEGLPCSVVAVGCAMQTVDKAVVNGLLGDALSGSHGPKLQSDGYLSLNGLNGLIRANLSVKRRENFRRGERPTLQDFAHSHRSKRAVVCVYGHYLYFDGRDYHSFFKNGEDPVVSVWYLD